MAKCKKYEDGGEVDGGLTFAEMSDEDREAQAKARMAEMGGDMPEESKVSKPANRVATKAKSAPVKAKTEPRTVSKINPITGPEPAKSRTAAMPDVAARKAQTEQRRSSALPSGQKFMGSYKSGGSVSASKRADGIAQRGKTKGRMV